MFTNTHVIHHYYNWSGTFNEQIMLQIAHMQDYQNEMNLQTAENWQTWQSWRNGYYQPEPVVITEAPDEYNESGNYFVDQYIGQYVYQHNVITNGNNGLELSNSNDSNRNEMSNSNDGNEFSNANNIANELNECNETNNTNEISNSNNTNELNECNERNDTNESSNSNELSDSDNRIELNENNALETNSNSDSNELNDNDNRIELNEFNELNENNESINSESNDSVINNELHNADIESDGPDFNASNDSISVENMPIMGYYLTKSKSKWIEIFHLPHNPKNERILRLGGYTCKRQVYSEVFFNIVSWNRLYTERNEIVKILKEKNHRTPYKYYLNRKFSVELCFYDDSVDKMLCFIQNQDKFYMKRKTFVNLLSHDEWVRNNLSVVI